MLAFGQAGSDQLVHDPAHPGPAEHGPLAQLGSPTVLDRELALPLFGKSFGLLGHSGFFLTGHTLDAGVLALFLFQLMFMDTAATIPTGALAERWKFLSFVLYGFFVSTVLYPVYGNWVWGNGWLAGLGHNFGLGHGHVDFAGSSVVHLIGGVTWGLMAIAFQPTLRLYGLRPFWGLGLPIVAAFYLFFTLDSAYQHRRGRGGLWKGRIHANVSGRP